MALVNAAKIHKVVKYFVFLAFAACQNDKMMVEKDLEFIKNQIQDNHPGIYNHNDPDFAKNFNTNYQQAFQKTQTSPFR